MSDYTVTLTRDELILLIQLLRLHEGIGTPESSLTKKLLQAGTDGDAAKV